MRIKVFTKYFHSSICRKHSIMKLFNIVTALIAFAAISMSSAVSQASITIVNPGFEDPVAGGSGVTNGSPPGWVLVGTGGVWNINSPTDYGFWDVGSPEGKQVGFLTSAPEPGVGSLPSSFTQVLTDTVDTGLYTLSGQVGHPRGYGANVDPSLDTIWTVELLAGATVIASNSGTVVPDAQFDPFSASVNIMGGSPFIGQPLSIRLSTNNAQTAFDQVSLDVVPEAASVAIWSILVGLVGLSRRANKTVACCDFG